MIKDRDIFSRVGAKIAFTQFLGCMKWFAQRGWRDMKNGRDKASKEVKSE